MKSGKMQKIYKTIMLIILTAAVTFIITSVVTYNSLGKNTIKYVSVDSDSNIEKTFQTFHNFIEKNYLGDINENQMLEYAIKGYVAGLEDDYSEYITKEEMDEYMQDAIGKYVGVGLYLTNNTKTNQIVVLMPIKGSPAEEAGIKSGDVITKVDGIEYNGEQLKEASNALKKEEGTTALIEVLRNDDELKFEVERKTIKINHVEAEVLEDKIGYINISTFDEGCYEEFLEKWNELSEKGITSLIIDLRNNGGGIVDESINIADTMTEKDATLLITASKNKEEKITKAKHEKSIDMPIVILINENTASSSEILAAAVKENNDKVTLIGTNSFGKGVIQTIYNLSDGSGLKLTTNEYYTPKHNKINKIGIKPDIEVKLPEEESLYTIERNKDSQLKKAIETLKQ